MTERRSHGTRHVEREEPRQRGRIKVAGTVHATTPPGGGVGTARLVTREGMSYTIVPDERGRELADLMAGRRTVAIGTVMHDSDGSALFTVKRFREAGASGHSEMDSQEA
ncbi:hypothetical protein HQ576_16330 [bacterium]|nr:hypothetical protein [bacterium]